MVKNLPADAGNAGDLGLSPRLGRSPGRGNGNPLQYSCLENSTEEEPAGYSSWGHKELDMTERLNNKSTGSTFDPIEATLVGLLGGNWSLERLHQD